MFSASSIAMGLGEADHHGGRSLGEGSNSPYRETERERWREREKQGRTKGGRRI
jgi:hypothetical protein